MGRSMHDTNHHQSIKFNDHINKKFLKGYTKVLREGKKERDNKRENFVPSTIF